MLDDVLGLFGLSEIERKMKNAFRKAGLYEKKRTAKGEEVKIYPTLYTPKKNDKYDEIDFKLPHSIDPKLVHDKWYVFENYFSQSIKLVVDNNNGHYRIRHFKDVRKGAYPYNYEELKPHLKKYRLPFVYGTNELGEWVIQDLAQSPTGLVGGLMGAGKSSLLRIALTTFIKYAKEKNINVKLLLNDMKKAEFHIFRNVDIVGDIVTMPDALEKRLAWVRKEIDRRSDLLDKYEVSHIDGVNKQMPKGKKIPYLLFCIDEISVISKNKDAMDELVIVCNLGRALGVYTFISTQRPCAETLDTRLRSQLEVKAAFRTRDKSNSDLVMGHGFLEDASKIKDKGKCFVVLPDRTELVQVPYLDVGDYQVLNGKIHNNTGEQGALPIDNNYPVLKGAKELLNPYRVKKEAPKEQSVVEIPKSNKQPTKLKKGLIKDV